jgi:hypothetical protein
MKKLLILAAIVQFVFIACRKEEATVTCTAGTGGGVTLIVKPQHHGAPINGATAHIKFNSQTNAGAISNYDMHVTGEAGEDHIHVTGLKCGDYFIYCVGYDSTISMPVFGGIPYVIHSGQSGEIEVHVPVTE